MDNGRNTELTAEMLAEVEQFGGVLFSPKEIAVLLQVDFAWLKDEFRKKGELWQAYERGRLRSLFEVRKNVFDMAKHGSGPAQTIVSQYELKLNLSYEEDITYGE